MDGVIAPATVTGNEGETVPFFVQISTPGIEPLRGADDPERDAGVLDVFRKRPPVEDGGVLSFDHVTASVTALADAMTRALKSVAPDEGEVEFGIDVGVESGQLTSLLVKGTGNATLKVRLLWKKSNEQASSGG
jgi:hypothetical protein